MYRYPIALVAVFLLFAACNDQPSGPHPDDAAERSAALVKGEAGDIDLRDRHIVVFRDDVGNPDILIDQMTRGNESNVHFRYRHAIKGFCATLPEQAIEAIARNPNVDYIEADAPMSIFWTKQESIHISWGLDRIDQRDLPLNNIYWYDANGSDVTAYIIDTGIRYTHDDFNSRASYGFDAFGGNGSDGNGHGTHVAGTVGGTFWGVAKNVNLVSVRVLDNNGGGTISTVVAGVDY
ncbi:MAG: S8 family serine peptidase, partial [Bacteroidetes bacterium]|nr:S8 family serine peptidase [Bacteroidota bacterium]